MSPRNFQVRAFPMDDFEDDARYPPNPNYRSRPPTKVQFNRNFDDQDDDFDEYQSNSDKINTNVNKVADLDDDDDDDESSLESRGKRRKLDNFEFIPRKPPPFVPNSRTLAVKNSPPDWSEDFTFLLLDAWGEIFIKNGRKSLRSDQWSEVAKKVNQDSTITRSDSQCRNRLDALKKKYKKEKASEAEVSNFKSDWVYFEKMDSMMSSVPMVPTKNSSPLRLLCGVDAGEYVFANSGVYMSRANALDEMRDSPGDTGTEDGGDDDDESDGLPPTTNEKRTKGREQSGSFSSSTFKMLAESIKKFGEVYEKIESSKRQQMVELERMRKEFCRDLKVQNRQIIEKVQAEIARLREEDGEEGDDGDDDENDELNGSGENFSI